MKQFLELLYIKSEKEHIFNSNYDIIDLEVKVRDGKICKSGTPDLIITYSIREKEDKDKKEKLTKHIILLEAKLLSLESPNQCINYYDELKDKLEYKDYEKTYVYLTLDGHKSSAGDKYINLTYQELVDYVYTPCSFKKTNPNVILTIDEYLKGFNQFYFEDLFMPELNNIVMSYRGKELTLNIWFKFEELFNDIFKQENQRQEIYDFIKSNYDLLKILFFNLIVLSNKKIIKISDKTLGRIKNITSKKPNNVNDETCYNSEFVYKAFKYLIDEEKITDISQLNDINYCNNNYKCVYTEKEFEMIPHYRDCYSNNKYGSLKIGEDNLYYTVNISVEEINYVLDKIGKSARFKKYADKIYRIPIEKLLKNKK